MATVTNISPLGPVWATADPFLFCVHHRDAYPAGNAAQGPDAPLTGRMTGQDFARENDWRMYHGRTVPGFPEHPHRGFETVTVVLTGYVDHSDSAGACGRYGQGDVQWMTAGSGMQHAEMFPLVKQDAPNPLELFQIWLNLPKKDKFTGPHYKMLWAEDIPVLTMQDDNGRKASVRIIAGTLDGTAAPEPAPASWAHDAGNNVAIWIITMAPDAVIELPAVPEQTRRRLFFFEGTSATVAETPLPRYHSADLAGGAAATLTNGPEPSRFLLLQGTPIDEPVAQHGPFVMNTQAEIEQAYTDYERTRFGGWPWDRSDPVHPAAQGRFARYADGTEEKRG